MSLPNQSERFVRRPETETISGLSPRRQAELEAEGEFPRPYRVGRRAVAHKLSELMAWMDSRPVVGGGHE